MPWAQSIVPKVRVVLFLILSGIYSERYVNMGGAVYLLGIAASPRADSNSETLLKESLSSLQEKVGASLSFDIVDLKTQKINSCLACNECGKSKRTQEFIPCVQEASDDVHSIFAKMMKADGIIVSTPVYFGLPTDLFMRFISRTRLLRHQDFRLANKPVGIMAIAGRRSGGGEITIMASWNPFIRNGCLVVGNGDATCQYGAIAWAGSKGSVLKDEWGMAQGKQVVERVYSIARIIKDGLQVNPYSFPMSFSFTAGMPGE